MTSILQGPRDDLGTACSARYARSPGACRRRARSRRCCTLLRLARSGVRVAFVSSHDAQGGGHASGSARPSAVGLAGRVSSRDGYG